MNNWCGEITTAHKGLENLDTDPWALSGVALHAMRAGVANAAEQLSLRYTFESGCRNVKLAEEQSSGSEKGINIVVQFRNTPSWSRS